MLTKVLAVLLFLSAFFGFNSEAKAQSGGAAFSSSVTAQTGNTNIDITSTEPVTVTNVYKYNPATSLWEEIPATEYATTPGDPSKKPKINFINGLVSGAQYKVKYSWTSSKTPTVTVATS